ncbi:hypothetical protein WHR41_07204 [Cladosporium halotolerans]|uniref:Nucleoporin NUP53 n=1 Tax=Cladosporium halotolerans TaxID=1052096 RepID=A0AB34KII3_9PEZI
MNGYPNFGRGGMQVHAVPENERYIDATGKRLPWAYERADGADITARREPVEKGPFGRSMRRRGTSRSRSKTAEPRKEEDRIKIENMAAEDAVFNKLRTETREKDSGKGALQTIDPNSVAGAAKNEVKEPTEILIYGFGDELQWAAIEFYENVSNGVILEDYERQPPGYRQDLSRSSLRVAAQRTLSKASLRRKNTFHGGNHWIKVTFDSPEGADLACSRSPHLIRGHLVYAEPYRGTGPSKDEPIFASSGGAQITSDALPKTFATNLPNDSPTSSETISSATVGGAPKASQPPPRMGSFSNQTQDAPPREASSTALERQRSDSSAQLQLRPARIQGATRAVLLPAEQALLPKRPSQSWATWIAGSEIFGSTLPRREDGSFDYERANVYWRLIYLLDCITGWDMCGLKADE